jgi:CBS domain containing-hemolysin-like protein
MEQDRFRGNAAANDLSSILGQSAAPTANNPRNILGQSAAAVPVLPHSAEIEALLQQMRRKESNRQASNRNFYGS